MIPKVRNAARRAASRLCLNASDMESAALAGLALAQRGFDPERGVKFTTYAYTIIHNLMLRDAHYLGRELTVLDIAGVDETVEFFSELIPDESPGPEDFAITTEQAQDLWHAVAELPAREALVVRLRYQNSLSVREIAQQIGLSRSHTNKILCDAIKKLRAVSSG